MAGQYTNYYHRIGKGKSKRYQCLFESCGNHIVKKLSSIYSHLERTHGYEIYEIKKEKREEIERERRAKEFAEQQLKEYERMLPQIKLQKKLEIKRQEEERRLREGLKKIEEEHRRREEARKIEMWNKVQKELQEAEVINRTRRRQKENIRKLFAYHMIFEKEKPTWEDFYLYYLSV